MSIEIVGRSEVATLHTLGRSVAAVTLEHAANDVQATYCSVLVDSWCRLGIRHAVVAPGSRSTPLAVALARHRDVRIHVVLDERSAGFVALGLGLGGTAALLLCTSGTAAANFLPAVVEANLSDVPMLVVTADRPAELRGIGAPQTIDQADLYGRHVRWAADVDVVDTLDCDAWRDLANKSVDESRTGPVQLNVAFDEPLLGDVLDDHIDGGIDGDATRPDHVAARDAARRKLGTALPELAPRGVIVAGGRSGVDPDAVAALSAATGWPIIADAISAMRGMQAAVTTAESLLRIEPFASSSLPDTVVRIGRPPTSKTLNRWVDESVAAGGCLIQVGGPGVVDPSRNVMVRSTLEQVAAAARRQPDEEWRAAWSDAEAIASKALSDALVNQSAVGLTEPLVARIVADHLDSSIPLIVSASMPIRDHEWFGGARAVAHANRGANGIDGVISTARGRAIDHGSAAVLIGDIAFLHDSNALIGLADRNIDLRIVVLDNNGGGIFSFLHQASALDPAQFEQLFGTPHGTDIVALGAAHRLEAVEVVTATELKSQLSRPGPWVARVATDRSANVDEHQRLHAAVATAMAAEHPCWR